MKKRLTTMAILVAISSMMFFGASGYVYAEEDSTASYTTNYSSDEELSYEDKVARYGHKAGDSLREDMENTSSDEELSYEDKVARYGHKAGDSLREDMENTSSNEETDTAENLYNKLYREIFKKYSQIALRFGIALHH